MKKIIILALILGVILPGQLLAIDYPFNPDFIISDADFTNYRSMTRDEIQECLESRNSGLATLMTTDFEEVRRFAADIIYNAAHESQINPKVILTTLQKEQTLITDLRPTQKRLDRAMGYRCPDSGSCHPNTLHFGKQVDGAAWQFRQYIDNHSRWNFRVNGTYDIDGVLVSPSSMATAALYNYTPHQAGNRSFWKIWQDFWGNNYPDGSLVQVRGDATVWLIQYTQRRAITSRAVLLSRFNPKQILPITQTDLEKYSVGSALKFANYSLLRNPGGTIYLLVDDEIRKIASPEVFRSIGFNWEEIDDVSNEDLLAYHIGDSITVASTFPTGGLLQNKKNGGVYYVENGVKHPLVAREFLKVNYPDKPITPVSPEELDKFLVGSPVLLRDGTLVKADTGPSVYVIASGKRRPILSEKAFAKFGYRWDNIVVTTQKAVELHELGEILE